MTKETIKEWIVVIAITAILIVAFGIAGNIDMQVMNETHGALMY